MNNKITRPERSELLMPAGDLFKLKMAVLYGADAVYLGTPDLSLRTKSAFTIDEVLEGIKFAHSHGKRVYLTLNLFAHNKDIEKVEQYIDTIKMLKPDGLIIADPGVFNMVKERAPELELHISTQANLTSYLAVKFWQDQGASLCVMARELSYAELAEIRQYCPEIKLEAFVHGAMCMTYSGRCMLSNYLVERGANQGNCANSCRWNYKVHMKLKDGTIKELELNEHTKDMFEFLLEEGCREGELMPIEEDDRGTYILNAKDLCLMPKLNDYLNIGIDSLKVEGRNKSPYYVGLVARSYRMAIDDWYKDPENWNPDAYMKELHAVQNRGYSLAFHDGRLTHHSHNYEDTHSLAEFELAAYVTKWENDDLIIEIKNKIIAGDVLEFVPPANISREIILLRIYEFENADNGNITKEINAGQRPSIRINIKAFDQVNPEFIKKAIVPMTIVRKEKTLTIEEFDRLKLDREAENIELNNGKGTDKAYFKKLEKLQNSMDDASGKRIKKSPRLGEEGCCGKGCNGCLIFWHDPTYEKARELLKTKKIGHMFDKKMAS